MSVSYTHLDVYKRQGYADHSFDAITLWHVMEHLEHLNETWEKLFKLLKERGVLIVAVDVYKRQPRLRKETDKFHASHVVLYFRH